MTEHHPAIASQIAEHQDAAAKCLDQVNDLRNDIGRLLDEREQHKAVIAAYIDAEQRFSEYGAAWHGLPAPPEAINTTGAITLDQLAGKVPFEPPPDERHAKRVKRDVRGAVMTCFAAEGNHLLSENFVVERTGLPATSLRSYLLRAVKAGELVREGQLYRLPVQFDDQRSEYDVPYDDPEGEEFEPPQDPAAPELQPPVPPWPPSPEKIINMIRHAGESGVTAAELEQIGATDDQLDELLSAGRLDYQDEDRRYRVAEDREEPAP